MEIQTHMTSARAGNRWNLNQVWMWVLAVTLALLVTLTYWPTLNSWFSADDFMLLKLAKRVWSLQQPSTLLFDSHNHLLTPLSNLLFWFEYQLFGLNFSGYQLVSLMLHWINAALVGVLALKMGGSRKIAVLSSLIFAVAYPIQEAVNWVAAYVHLLSALFYFLSLINCLLWVNKRQSQYLVFTLVTLFLGMLTKEDLLTACAMLVLIVLWGLYEGKLTKRECVKGIALFGGIGLAYIFIVLWWHFGMSATQPEQKAYHLGLHGIANYRYLIGLLIPPPDYVPFVAFVQRLMPAQALTLYQIGSWSLLAILAALAVWTLVYGNNRQRFLIALILIAFAPFSMTTVGISLRYLYIPYAGFAILLAEFMDWLAAHIGFRRATPAFVLFLMANILTIWTWQLQMNKHGDIRSQLTYELASAYDSKNGAQSSICVFELPERHHEIQYAIGLFTVSPPPKVVFTESDCPATGALRYRFDGGSLSALP
jgi:hypothetical protein